MFTSILWNIIYTVIVLHGMCSVAALRSFFFFFFFFLRFSPKSNILQLLFFFFFLHSPLTDGLVDDCRLLDYTSISSSIPHLSSFLFSSSRRTVTFSFLVILNYRFFRRTGEGEREGQGWWERWSKTMRKSVRFEIRKYSKIGWHCTLNNNLIDKIKGKYVFASYIYI